MTCSYDPKEPRRNPEFWEIWRVIQHKCKEMKDARTFAEIRGHCMVLQVHINDLLEEPEFVRDLVEGPVPGAFTFLAPGGDQPEGQNLENPFDQPGPAAGMYFYYTYSGQITGLFTGGENVYDPFSLSVYWVIRFEKVYAAAEETRFHIPSEAAFNKIHQGRPRPRRDAIGQYAIFMDPKGIYDGGAARIVGIYKNRKRAISRVDQLSRKYGIRYMAARLVGFIDTH